MKNSVNVLYQVTELNYRVDLRGVVSMPLWREVEAVLYRRPARRIGDVMHIHNQLLEQLGSWHILA